jgi:tripartite-type tricarboxylate transporter receptor subunit TctC
LLDRKVPDLPDIPTLRDLGYMKDLPSPWAGLYGPAGMSEDAKKVLIPAIEQAIKTPELMSKIQKLWFLPSYKPPAEHKALWVEDYENAKALSKKMGFVK